MNTMYIVVMMFLTMSLSKWHLPRTKLHEQAAKQEQCEPEHVARE